MVVRYRVLIPVIIVGILYACTGYRTHTVKTKGVYHRVKSGETLWSIARVYNVHVQDIAEANNITDANTVKTNSVLFIPDATFVVDDTVTRGEKIQGTVERSHLGEKKSLRVRQGESEREAGRTGGKRGDVRKRDSGNGETEKSSGESPQKTIAKADRNLPRPETKGPVVSPKETTDEVKNHQRIRDREKPNIKIEKNRFVWPVKGVVKSKFGIQPNGMYHNGILIEAKEGSLVVAAAAGTVIYSAPVKDYGETIIIKHEDDFATVYTHLGVRLVKVNEHVNQGEKIAYLGKTEQKGGVYLNFEIRHKNKARNPLFFLP